MGNNNRDWLLVGRELLDSHGLHHWKIGWMSKDSTTICARCRPKLRAVELNKGYFTKTTFTPSLFDSLLHEVAHCLDLEKRQITRHDAVWRDIYITIGGSGKTVNDFNIPK